MMDRHTWTRIAALLACAACGGGEDGTTEGTSATEGTTTDAGYCDFEEDAATPFLALEILGGGALEDGVQWPLECGGQGSWMFGIYPSVGGWDPMASDITFTVSVDVEGFNVNPDGHFFSGQVGYYVGCEFLMGVTGVISVIPFDTILDLSALDGLPATVHVEIDGGGTPLSADASVTLSAPKSVIDLGCVPGI